MQKLNLDAYNVSEMNDAEMQDVNGGNAPFFRVIWTRGEGWCIVLFGIVLVDNC